MRSKTDSRDYVIAQLQVALDAAHARVHELEAASEVMAARIACANERADEAEQALWQTQLRLAIEAQRVRPDVMPPGRG